MDEIERIMKRMVRKGLMTKDGNEYTLTPKGEADLEKTKKKYPKEAAANRFIRSRLN